MNVKLSVRTILLLVTCGALSSWAFPTESILHDPKIQTNQDDPENEATLARGQSNVLCFQSVLAGRIVYDRSTRKDAFDRLVLPPGVAENQIDSNAFVKYFSSSCKSDATGVALQNGIKCIRKYFVDSGYGSSEWSYIISPNAVEAPPGSSLDEFRHDPTPTDFRTYVKLNYGMILAVGMYTYDFKLNTWSRVGGHYVGVYGYDYDEAKGDNAITLHVSDPTRNYFLSGSSKMTNAIQLIKAPVSPDSRLHYAVSGMNDLFPGVAIYAESLLVFTPQR
jgi:hypothetical protein